MGLSELTGIRNSEMATFQGEFCTVLIYTELSNPCQTKQRYIEVTVIQRAGLVRVYCIDPSICHHLQGACVFVAALLHYLFTTVFFWMLCEGIMLYLMLVLVFNQISKKWWIFLIIGWGKCLCTLSFKCVHQQPPSLAHCMLLSLNNIE